MTPDERLIADLVHDPAAVLRWLVDAIEDAPAISVKGGTAVILTHDLRQALRAARHNDGQDA